MADVIIDSNVHSQRRAPSSARRAPGAEASLLRSLTSWPATNTLPILSVGVVGTGELSAAVAERLVDARFPVTLHGASIELLDEGLASLDARLNARVRKGVLTRAERDRRSQLVCPTCWYVAMSSADVVIVCDDECEGPMQTVFESLDHVMKRGAILATTATSSSLGKLATRRRGDVVGIRFSRAGGEMRLAELERDGHTSDDAEAMLMSLARALDGTPS
jgi:3-hydroxyacyl-CoA dehydrogenase